MSGLGSPVRGRRPRGKCCECSVEVSLNGDGTIRSHGYRKLSWDTYDYCTGTGLVRHRATIRIVAEAA